MISPLTAPGQTPLPERLLAILEETSDLVSTADLEGRITYMNRACRRRLDIGEESSALTLRDRHPEGAARALLNDAIPLAIDRGSWRGESVYLDGEGREIPVSLIVIAHRDEEGVVRYFSSIAREIVEEKRRERRIEERAERFRFLAEAAAETFWTWDLRADAVNWSPALCALLDFPPEEFPISLTRMMDRVHPGDEPPFRAALVAHLERDVPFAAEARFRHRNGSYRLLECRGKAARDEGGHPVRMAGSMRDVTDQKMAEAMLRLSERKYRALVETTGTGFVVLDGEGIVLDANARFLELCGRAAISDVLGRNAFEWIVPREGRAHIFADGFVRSFEVDCERPDGTTVPLHLNAGMIEEGGERRLVALCSEAD